MRRFISEINAKMAYFGMSAKELADKAQVKQSTLYTMLGGRKPNDELIKALCNQAWPDKDTGLDIAQAWLEDELERTGRSSSEIEITVKGVDDEARALDDDFRVLSEWLPNDVDMRALITFLAETARNEINAMEEEGSEPDDKPNENWYKLKMYGVAAGKPTNGDETDFQVSRNYGPGHYALKVCGQSMEPDVADGSVIIMASTSILRSPYPKKGLIYDFMLNSERTLKRYNTRVATDEEVNQGLHYESRGAYRVKVLESINPDYPEIVMNPAYDIKLLGWYNPENQVD